MLSAFARSNLRFYWREGSHLFRTGGEGVQEIFGRSSGVESASAPGVDRVAARSNVIKGPGTYFTSFVALVSLFSLFISSLPVALRSIRASNNRIQAAVGYILD